MRKIAAALGVVVMGIGVLVAASTGPASAHSTTSTGITSLHVVVGAPQGPGPSTRTEPVVVLLRCAGPGNEHPYPVQACAEIEAADGNISAIPPLQLGCPGSWQPVEISVSGVIRGEPVLWSRTTSNEGCAVIGHGHVFRIPLYARPAPQR